MSFILIADTETTSVDQATGSLVEVAAARFDLERGKLIDARSTLVRLSKGEHGAEEVHGIPAHLPADYGVTDISTVARYATGAICCVAHHSDFDRQWLPAEMAPWADSMDFEWPKPIQSRSLTAIALAHGVGVVAAHRALDDVLTLARVLERCRELGADLEHMVRRAMRPKVLVAAYRVPIERNDELKAAGFRWHPKPVAEWRKKMFADEVSKLGFPTKEISNAATGS